MAEQASSSRKRAASGAVRTALVRLQRGVQRRMQAEVNAFTGGSTPRLERYHREYLREFRRYQSAASYGELHDEMLDSDLVLIGDYHTLRQSQQVALRLFERALADPRPVRLAVEMVFASHQHHLDAYLDGRLDDAAFLRAIRYRHTWNFDWANYKPLFDAARAAGIPVVGINHTAAQGRDRLRERDERIAATLAEYAAADPEARLLVLIGDLHLASNHLPRCLEERLEALGLKRRRLVVYQNSDELYWELARRGSEMDTQVVRLGRDRYCVMEVPPYVKLVSYLGWEQASDRVDDGDEDDPSGTQLLHHLVPQLCEFLGLQDVDVECDVFANLDKAFFDAVENAPELGERRQHEIRLHALSNRSCFVPELDAAYLPFFSVNHAAEEAMHVVQSRVAGFRPVCGDAYEDFYARVLWYACGFAGSKIVNPRRRTASEETLRTFLGRSSRRLRDPELGFRKLVARFVVQHLEHERDRCAGRRGRLKQIYDQGLEVTLEVTQSLGYLLGDRIAEALRDGSWSADEFRALVMRGRTPAASSIYFDLIQRLTPLRRR